MLCFLLYVPQVGWQWQDAINLLQAGSTFQYRFQQHNCSKATRYKQGSGEDTLTLERLLLNAQSFTLHQLHSLCSRDFITNFTSQHQGMPSIHLLLHYDIILLLLLPSPLPYTYLPTYMTAAFT